MKPPQTVTEKARILLVDDEPDIRASFRLLLADEHDILEAGDSDACLDILEREPIDLILLDQMLPGMSGLELLETLRKKWEEPRVIMVSGTTDSSVVFRAAQLGVDAFIRKTTNNAELLYTINKALERIQSRQKMARLESELEEYRQLQIVRSKNARMQQIDEIVKKVGKLPTTVLILGESGTGKEVIARQIYEAGGDPNRPYVRVNMASIPGELVESTLFGHEKGSFTGAIRQQYGKFELASGGVLFMDEIGELPLDLQSKLLRVIQEGEFERVGGNKTIKTQVRLVAATNKDLQQQVAAGRFREDLYYRLNVVPITLPPLRERPEDIAALAKHFIVKYATRFNRPLRSVTDEALRILQGYQWPGNIRELENLIERLVAIGESDSLDTIDVPMEYQVDSLPQEGSDTGRLEAAVDSFERNFIRRALKLNDFHRANTAKYLGIPLSTLKYKMTRLKISDR
jgi:DNA-binding NtrC family response regulator